MQISTNKLNVIVTLVFYLLSASLHIRACLRLQTAKSFPNTLVHVMEEYFTNETIQQCKSDVTIINHVLFIVFVCLFVCLFVVSFYMQLY